MKLSLLFAAAFMLAAIPAPAAEPASADVKKELYTRGNFDSFFLQDYDLTLRDYNTFSSVAGSDIVPNDSRCSVTTDPMNAENRVLKMDYTQSDGTGSGFNTFFVRLSRLPSQISSQGGEIEISFDFRPEGWDDPTVIPIDKKLFFSFGNKSGQYFVAADKTAISEPNANAVENYSSFEESKMQGYRRVRFSTRLTAAETSSDNLTFWFYNAKGKTAAYLDNFSVLYRGAELLYEGSFESFDLATYACPDVSVANPLSNWGVSSRSNLMDYSSARLVKNEGVRFAAGQGVFSGAGHGSLVDFTLGGEQIFSSEKDGIYTVSADVRLSEGDGAKFDLELTNFADPSLGRTVNLFGNGGGYYEKLSASSYGEGWRKLEYTLFVTASEAEQLDCLTFVFDTGDGARLSLNNLSVSALSGFTPALLWTSGDEVNRGDGADYLLGTNFGELGAELYLLSGNEKEAVASPYYRRTGNVFTIDRKLFNLNKADGIYTLRLETQYGAVEKAVSVFGRSNLPEATENGYAWRKKGDLSVTLNLNGAEILSVSNEGITLNEREYTVSGDVLILREGYLNGLTAENNIFTVVTTNGEFFFTVTAAESSAFPAWAIGVIVAASIVAVAGIAVGAVFGYKKNKRK